MSLGLETEGLHLTPSGVGTPVLRGVDLELAAGERAVLVGPSGAGKTTLLRAIAGLEEPDQGEVRLAGIAQTSVPADRRRIGMVFQEPRLLPHLSVCDNVALPLRAAGIGRRERRQTACERLDEVGMVAFSERRIPGLSGGEQQRIALARALCGNPRALLLDEPLAALDPGRRESLRGLIAEVQEQRHLTTLIVTHDRAEAAELGQSIALMLEGRIVQHDDPRTLFEQPASAAVARFFGAANIIRLDGRGERTHVIRPEHIVVGAGPHRALVTDSTYRGTLVRLTLDWDGQRLEALVDPADAPTAGARVAIDLPDQRLWRLPDGAPERALTSRKSR